MPKYRKKPLIIEAEIFHSKGNIPNGVYAEFEGCKKTDYFIETLEGRMKVSDRDYVITGIEGEKYPCKPRIFEATYELVEE